MLNSTPPNSKQNKDNEITRYYKYLLSAVETNSMVTDATGIEQKNLCRYKATLEKEGYLWIVKNDYCKVTGHLADYLTTNPDLKPDKNQLKLFDD